MASESVIGHRDPGRRSLCHERVTGKTPTELGDETVSSQRGLPGGGVIPAEPYENSSGCSLTSEF